MMEPKTLDLAAQWVAKAEQDFLAVRKLTDSEPIPWGVVCFHCHQVAEKYLKAYLITQLATFPRTHNLLHLLDLIEQPSPSLAKLRESLIILNDFAVAARYPDDWWEPSARDGREAIQQTKLVRKTFKSTAAGNEIAIFLKQVGHRPDDKSTCSEPRPVNGAA